MVEIETEIVGTGTRIRGAAKEPTRMEEIGIEIETEIGAEIGTEIERGGVPEIITEIVKEIDQRVEKKRMKTLIEQEGEIIQNKDLE